MLTETAAETQRSNYEFFWIPGSWADDDLLDNMAHLYSAHYGIWGKDDPRHGQPIRLSPNRIREWLRSPDCRIAYAKLDEELVGYAIAVQEKIRGRGIVSWVTQFVVHEAHRQKNVGKTLLFTIWGFSDHFAWGLISANPYAVRALEKATRRRCAPPRIKNDLSILRRLALRVVNYFTASTRTTVNSEVSKVNTNFFLDHSQLPSMLSNVTKNHTPWVMGQIEPGWEWLAFTFHDQPQIGLTGEELSQMLIAADALTKHAYARMSFATGKHKWAGHASEEAQFIVQNCELNASASVLDFGCQLGRHALALAELGCRVVGIDYVEEFIAQARTRASVNGLGLAQFEVGDCRSVTLQETFDAGICLYDVIGTYADNEENFKILSNLAKHIKPHGFVLISVMNLELTERRARHRFSIDRDADKLLELKPANIMETSGDVFDPEYYLLDNDTKLVYRKEQFRLGTSLPEEFLVRDRRYTREGIQAMCERAGLKIIWSRFVRSGAWDKPEPRDSDKAKEILVLCRKE